MIYEKKVTRVQMLGKRWNNIDMTVYTVKGRFTNMWNVQRSNGTTKVAID